MRPHHFDRCSLFPRTHWYFEILQRGFEECFSSVPSGHLKSDFPPVVLHRKLSLEVRHASGMLITWPVHLICASFKTAFMLCIPAFFRLSVSGILSCHLILTAFSNSGNGEVSLHDVGILSRYHMHGKGFVVHSLLDFHLDSSLYYLNVYDLVVHAYFLDQGCTKECIYSVCQ